MRTADERFHWIWVGHHLVVDGASAPLVTARLAHRYRALGSGGPVEAWPAGGLHRLVEGDAAYAGSRAEARDRSWWRDRLAGAPTPARLVGAPSPAAAPGAVRRCGVELPAHLDAHVRVVAGGGRRPAALAVAAVAALVHRATGARDLLLAVPVAGRTGSLRSRPGMLANVVPVRLTPGPGLAVGELVERSGHALLAALRHQRRRGEDTTSSATTSAWTTSGR